VRLHFFVRWYRLFLLRVVVLQVENLFSEQR